VKKPRVNSVARPQGLLLAVNLYFIPDPRVHQPYDERPPVKPNCESIQYNPGFYDYISVLQRDMFMEIFNINSTTFEPHNLFVGSLWPSEQT
jgi:hypothetical protein